MILAKGAEEMETVIPTDVMRRAGVSMQTMKNLFVSAWSRENLCLKLMFVARSSRCSLLYEVKIYLCLLTG